MSEALKAEPAQVPEFLGTLRDEHSYFQSLLDIAREQQELLATDGDVDLDILQEVLQYLADYPEEYHHPREEVMCARLRELEPQGVITLDTLHAGHEEIHKESSHLYFSVMRLNNGESIDRAKLAATLGNFVTHYEKHMRDEEEGIFQRALDTLSDEDWAQIEESLERVDDPLFGDRVRRRYRHLANVLEARIGVAKRDFVMAEFLTLGAVIDSILTISETTVNFGYILQDRTGQTWRENLAAARDGIGSGKIGEVINLPSKFTRNTLNNWRAGFGETKELLGKAVEDIRTPYNMRMDALKEILREDWGH